MKLLTVSLSNYGPFSGDHSFSLDSRGLVLVRGDNSDEPRMNSNGAGKSSLIDAIDWCLFGTVPRGDSPESVVHTGCTECSVFVHMRDEDDIPVCITRSRVNSKQQLLLVYGEDDVTSLDTKETQRHIEWLLGMDRQVFHSTVLFAQQDLFQFADATDAERINILTKILRLEEIDAWQAQAKVVFKQAQADLNSALQIEAGLAARVEEINSANLDAQIAHFESERTSRLEAVNRQLDTLRTQIHGTQLVDTKELEAQLRATPSPRTPTRLAHLKNECSSRAELVAKGLQIKHVAEAEQQRLARIQKLGDKCPTCEQRVAQTHRQALDASIQLEAKKARDSEVLVKTLESQIAERRDEAERITQEYREQMVQHTQWSTELRGRIEGHKQANMHHQQLCAHAQQLQGDYDRIMRDANPYREQKAQNQSRLVTLQQEQQSAAIKKHHAELEAKSADFWVDACSQRGLKSYILDANLQEMTDAANDWIKLLTGGTIWIRMETTTTLKTGASRNKFTIRVFRQERDGSVTERNYKSWSGGEKQRVSLGIDFGLSRLVGRRAQKHYDILFLDEIFRNLDASGREAVMEMLQALRREKNTILVVDHDAEFQGMFEQRVTIRKKNGCSEIIEGDHESIAVRSEPEPDPESQPTGKRTASCPVSNRATAADQAAKREAPPKAKKPRGGRRARTSPTNQRA